MPDKTVVPDEKKFPIVHTVVPPRSAPPPQVAAIEEDSITRVARKQGWTITNDGKKWVVDAGGDTRIMVEPTGPAGDILRFMRVISGPGTAEEKAVDLLRQNATLAHCGYAADQEGRVALVATLLEDSADDGEIFGCLRSLVAGGERVSAHPIDQFDRSKYKQPPTTAESWESMVLRDSLDATGIAFQLSGAHALVVLRLPGERKQSVHVMFDRSDGSGDQLIQMISVCGPASDSEIWRRCLVMNATMTSATMALAKIGGVENLVVLRTQLASTADREEILVGVTTVGQMADRLEIELTGGKDIQ